jgi:hypothetical protein
VLLVDVLLDDRQRGTGAGRDEVGRDQKCPFILARFTRPVYSERSIRAETP